MRDKRYLPQGFSGPRQAPQPRRGRRNPAPSPTPPASAPAPEAPAPRTQAPQETPLPPPGPVVRFLARVLGSRLTPVIVLAVAAAVRAVHLRAFLRSPLADHLLLDHEAYDTWATRIAAGDWVGQGVFWVDPLYAYFLALIYRFIGHDLALVRALQCALGVGTVALTGWIARKITARPAVGNAAMGVAALFMPMVHNEVQIEKAALTTFLATAALAAFLRGTGGALVASGLLTGLSVLGRGNLLFAIPAGALALLLDREPVMDPDGAPWPDAVQRSMARENALRFTLAAVAVVGVLTVRNVVVAHEFLPTTAIGGPSLYAAQVRDNHEGVYRPPAFVRPATEYEHDDFHAEAERRTGHPMTDTAVNAYWTREALGEMLDDPGAVVARSWLKFRLALHGYEVPDNDDVEIAQDYSRVLRLPVFWMGQVMPFAILGVLVWWRRSRAARLTTGAVGIYLFSLVLFYVMGRIRLPMVPPVIALGAAGAAWWTDQMRRRDYRAVGTGAVVIAAGLAFCVVRPEWLDDQRSGSIAVSYNNLAAQFLAEGQTEAAIAAYQRAIATRPDSVIGAMRTLGDLYLQRRRYDDADRMMHRVLDARPDSPAGKAALVRLYETMARDPSTGGPAAVRHRLAAAYRAAGRESDAVRTEIETTQPAIPNLADALRGGHSASAGNAPTPPPAPLPAIPTAAPVASTVTETARSAMAAILSAAPHGSPVWILATDTDPQSIARSEELATVFNSAGWDVRELSRSAVRTRPGIFLFAADESPPGYVATAQRALDAAHLEPQLMSGYRNYYAERSREHPEFQGFPLAPDQTYVLVVGRVTPVRVPRTT